MFLIVEMILSFAIVQQISGLIRGDKEKLMKIISEELKANPPQLVEYINHIYEIERNLEELSPDEKHNGRQEQIKPVLDEFFAWLETVNASSGTKLAKAVQYALNEKKYLYRFLECPYVAIDNNRAENSVRPFVMGRKNWLFSDSVRGAEASALLYSLAVTACVNGLNVEDFFTG